MEEKEVVAEEELEELNRKLKEKGKKVLKRLFDLKDLEKVEENG